MKTCREYLKKYRKEQKMTQSALANKLGISQNYYSNIENGVRELKLGNLIKLSDALCINIQSLLDEEVKYRELNGG